MRPYRGVSRDIPLMGLLRRLSELGRPHSKARPETLDHAVADVHCEDNHAPGRVVSAR